MERVAAAKCHLLFRNDRFIMLSRASVNGNDWNSEFRDENSGNCGELRPIELVIAAPFRNDMSEIAPSQARTERLAARCGASTLGMVRPLWIATVATVLGCAPEMPDEGAARAAFEQRRGRVERLEAQLHASLAAMPLLNAADCDPTGTKAGDDLQRVTAQSRCTVSRARSLAEQAAAQQRFNNDTLPNALREAGAFSASVTAARAGRESRYTLGRVEPWVPEVRPGTVRAERGITVGNKRIGWGQYHTVWTVGGTRQGDDKLHSGIEVVWTERHTDTDVAVGVLFLTD